MKYGFVIDHRKCIGCHACTVACKEEHSVPLGVNRTWVKYIEKGEFPDAQRRFLVLRCNHCEDSPCTRICPTRALFVRPDGIVDFDNSRCIGCKACMQACPYDALYLDPNTSTAAKCNFCAHRVEAGLEPSCVVVCPERAITAGDLEDPNAEISRLLSREQIQVRKPEQGTKPKLFYIGADSTALNPAAAPVDGSYLWAHPRVNPNNPHPVPVSPGAAPSRARKVLDVHHPRPWGWKISLYLWTKAAAAGVLILAALLVHVLKITGSPLLTWEAPLVSLFFLGLTGVLLVADLKRPDRFFYLLTRSNFTSWLVWGAYILSAFGAAAAAWFLAAALGRGGILQDLAWPAVLLGAAAAGYSAFLFGQAEGRDFWQSPVLPWHLVAAALVAGSAVLLALSPWSAAAARLRSDLSSVLAGALVLNVLLILGELYVPHVNADVKAAALLVRRGAYRRRFWGGVVGLGFVIPLAFLAGSVSGPSTVGAALAALAGLYLYEDLWVRAGQAVPLS